MSARDQQLVDTLQTAIPRAQLVLQSAQRQHEDASAVLDALAHAVTLLRPAPARDGSLTVAHLEQAVIRSGHTWAEIMSGLSRERLANVVAGDPLTTDERHAPCWKTGRADMSDKLTDEEWEELRQLQQLVGEERLRVIVTPLLERLAQATNGRRLSVARALLEALRVEAKKHVR